MATTVYVQGSIPCLHFLDLLYACMSFQSFAREMQRHGTMLCAGLLVLLSSAGPADYQKRDPSLLLPPVVWKKSLDDTVCSHSCLHLLIPTRHQSHILTVGHREESAKRSSSTDLTWTPIARNVSPWTDAGTGEYSLVSRLHRPALKVKLLLLLQGSELQLHRKSPTPLFDRDP